MTDRGIVGRSLIDISDDANCGLCTTLGPNFLRLMWTYHHCPEGSYEPHMFESYKIYCDCYKNASPTLKNCLATSVVDTRINEKGLIDIIARVGQCCESLESSVSTIFSKKKFW